MNRAINAIFLQDLKEGKLKAFLLEVKKDHTLCLELRGTWIAIYYRGGRLFTISFQWKNGREAEYEIKFNKKAYCKKEESANWEYLKEKCSITKAEDANEIIKYLPYYKQALDYHFNVKNTLEREFQQLILRDNNSVSPEVANATDYFILDMEYTFDAESKANARADMLALKWESTSRDRRNNKKLPLAFIEVKYGDTALEDKTSGISGHLKDFVTITQGSGREILKGLCEDMTEVFRQKREMGLITGCGKSEVTISYENPELIFVFANHDPDKSALRRILLSEAGKYPETVLKKVLVAKASEMGYGLFNSGNKKFPNIREYLGIGSI